MGCLSSCISKEPAELYLHPITYADSGDSKSACKGFDKREKE